MTGSTHPPRSDPPDGVTRRERRVETAIFVVFIVVLAGLAFRCGEFVFNQLHGRSEPSAMIDQDASHEGQPSMERQQ